MDATCSLSTCGSHIQSLQADWHQNPTSLMELALHMMPTYVFLDSRVTH